MMTTNNDLAAEDIAEDLLYRTGQALVHGQFEGVADCFVLPQMLETVEGARIVRTARDVVQVFEAVRKYFDENDVADVARTILEAKFIADDAIESVHVGRLIQADGQLLRAPYPAYSLLKKGEDGIWRIAHTSYAILDSRDHSEALLAWRSETKD